VLFIFAREAAGAQNTRLSLRPLLFGGNVWQDSGASMPRECEVVSDKYERATFSAVIARESGRSSIPETLVMESSRRGVLDRPIKPGDDVWRLFDNRI
jgi:hypothetical protein